MLRRVIHHSVIILLLAACLSACSFTKKQAAPVYDLRSQLAEKRGYHVVQRGETFYFIAWRFGKDFRQLADINNLKPPYQVSVGQKIYLKGKTQYYQYAPKASVVKPGAIPVSQPTPKLSSVKRWLMPATGKIIKGYSSLNKGINIAGQQGEAIRASAAGEVVYAGDGLRTYGNLLIIKHNDIYLSAYAHNQRLLVKEGQLVKAGQKIATMGSSGTNRVMLHFELRKRGKPVNPLNYIK